MLLRFRFANFRSFRDEQELSLIKGPFTDKGTIPRTNVNPIKESVLPVAAIYGANASGKTNVNRAIEFIAEAVSWSHSRWEPEGPVPYQPFLGSPYGDPQPSEFEAEFITGAIRFRYGFRLNNIAILEEWLHAYPKGKKQTWFHRIQGEPISFSGKLPGANKTIETLTRKNSLFLSAAAQNNHEALLTPYQWLTGLCFVSGNRSKFRADTATLCKSPDYLEQISALISSADLGVAGLKIEMKPVPDQVMKFYTILKGAIDSKIIETPLPTPAEELQLLHRFEGKEIPFTPQQESEGTLTYLALLGPVVEALRDGAPLIVDELDASLHPLLSMHLVRLFNSTETNPKNAQLIFNTHDTNLLNSELLRRDQIWFTEKSSDGSTRLFPLSDFRLRRSDNLETGYLMGRYGGIPFIDPSALLKYPDAADDPAH